MTRRTAQTIAAALLAVGALATGAAPVVSAASAQSSMLHPHDSVWD